MTNFRLFFGRTSSVNPVVASRIRFAEGAGMPGLCGRVGGNKIQRKVLDLEISYQKVPIWPIGREPGAVSC